MIFIKKLKIILKNSFKNMYLIGDIGNTETKICLFNDKKKLLKKKDI